MESILRFSSPLEEYSWRPGTTKETNQKPPSYSSRTISVAASFREKEKEEQMANATLGQMRLQANVLSTDQ